MKIRDAKKQASRERVLDAARFLFEEVGFHETTVRMIAERAGLSPGGVFTTFEDKVGILCQILGDYRERLFDEIERLVPSPTGSTRERLHAVIVLAHAHEFPRMRMVLAYIGASYCWSRRLEEEHRALHGRFRTVITAIVAEGVERGEIDPKVDADLLVEMICAVYLRNYRTAFYAGFGEHELNGRTRRQLDLLFEGACAR
ncbi:MAG TPA: TetR/AcrR family transcriptional regulator [Caulobacteraceae bacterium]|jgi:AcrR family transcriptional regulator|nr:TetR/AcrR family transcriptional regulator [Caulobacteraceae bacterium]